MRSLGNVADRAINMEPTLDPSRFVDIVHVNPGILPRELGQSASRRQYRPDEGGTAMATFTPPVYPQIQEYPSTPPTRPGRNRWVPVAAAFGVGAAIAATVTALIFSAQSSSPVAAPAATVTVTPSTPTPPPPLPEVQANRATCNGWLDASKLIDSAIDAGSVVPKPYNVLSPEVRSNPDWSAAVQKAAGLYGRASTALGNKVADGATPVLFQTAKAETAALQALSVAYASYDLASGNTYTTAKEGSDAMNVLCERLAP